MKQQEEEILLEVRNLKKYFPVSKRSLFSEQQYAQAVDGVSFQVRKGKTLGIVGESGCGKTTIGRMIVQLTPATDGEILFEGRDILKCSLKEMKELHQKIQFVFQDPYASLNPKMKIGDILAEPMKLYHFADKTNINEKVEKLLGLVGLPKEAAKRYPHEFSGGQRQRVGIARALALNPQLIICDEPVSALDVSIQSQIINLLQELQRKFGLTYIFVAHGLNVVKHISDDVGVMYLGKMMELSPADELFEHPYHPYTRALLDAIPMPDPNLPSGEKILEGEVPGLVNIPKRCRFCTRCPFAQEKCFHEEPQMQEISPNHQVACHFPVLD